MSKRNSNKPIIPSEKIFVGYPKKSQFFEDNRNYEEQKMSPKKVEFDKILKKTNRGRKALFPLPDKLKCEIFLQYFDISEEKIFSCFICKNNFHKSCYNQYDKIFSSTDNPNPSLICVRCVKAKKLNKNIYDKSFNCIICGRSDKILNYNFINDYYYHFICSIFINELFDLGEGKTEKEKIRKWRYKNSCKYCGEKLSKNVAVIKCKKPTCKEYYHIPCSIKKGIIFDLNFMKTYYGISSIMKIPFYCSNHNKKIVIKYKNFIMNELKEKNEILSKKNFNKESKFCENLQKNNDNENSEESTIYLNSMSENINNKLLKNENNNSDNEKMKIDNDLYNSLNKDIFNIQFGYMLINEENIKKENFSQGLYSEIIYKKKINDVDKFYKNKNLDCLLNRENNYAYLNQNI